LLAPAICNFGPPYGFFVGQHIVAVTDAAEGCEKAASKRRGARQRRGHLVRPWEHRHLRRRGMS